MTKITRSCLILTVALGCFGCGLAHAAPSIAFVSTYFNYLDEYDAAGDLRAAGLEVGTLAWDAITADSLKPFNAIVLTDIPEVNEKGEVNPKAAAAIKVIQAYVAAGGGVFVCSGAGGWDLCRPATNLLLKPWDAELLDEQVTDPGHLYQQVRGIRWQYAWTTNITPSPITDGVKAIFYPSQTWRADGVKTLYTPKVGPAWQALVRGEKTARTVRNVPKTGAMETTPATYATEPPILVARDVEKGRVAVLSLWPNWTFWGARKKPMEAIVWEAGAGGVKSDMGKLCVQLLKWLAEPSVKSGALGGYVTPEKPATRPEEYPPTPVDWKSLKFPDPPTWKHHRVLAGARTKYGGGSGTVQEYVAAAKAAGYQAVLFTERLDRLTPENWNRLRDECKAATTADFLALPGLDYQTLQGDEYVAFGEFDFPKPPGLAADGKHIDDTYNLWGKQMYMGFLAITRLHAHPDRDPQMLKNMTACAVHTYEDGKLVDDSLDHYLALDAQYHNLVPFALHFVNSPDAVKKATTGLQNVWRVNDAADLKEQITPHSQAGLLYWLNPHRAYLSGGPTLDQWDGLNVMYWAMPTDGSDRWKLKFKVSAADGVREVKVFDRGEPYLRFANEGANCEREFPGFHDNQHVFHLLATDGKGNQLLSPGIRIRFSDAYINQCGDHQNTISATLQKNRKGRMTYTNGTTLAVYAGWRPSWYAPCPVDMAEEFPPSWDGGATGSGGSGAAQVNLEGGQWEGGENSASANLYEVAGPEVQILNQVVKLKYPEGTPPRGDCAPSYRTIPTEFIDYTTRRITPTAKFERTGISINEVTITAKKDFTLDSKLPIPLHGFFASDWGSRPEGISDHYFMSFADGRTITRVGPRGALPWYANGEMKPGNYVCAYPSANGAVGIFPLTPMHANVTITERLFGTGFGLSLAGKKVSKGDTWTLRYLAASASTSLEQGNLIFDEIRRTIGLGGPPAYRIEASRGEVKDTAGRLLATATDGAFAAKLSKATMPTDLFVEVNGLTDGWTAAKQVNGGPLSAVTLHGGTAYTNVDLNPGDVSLIIGHPVTCTDPRVRIIVWWTKAGLEVYIHNPTDKAIACTLRTNAAFKGLPVGEKDVTVAAGGSVSLSW